ncbi:MAG: hypothetical protein DRH20_14750, partial [Deltaproteobacteria bacterium]
MVHQFRGTPQWKGGLDESHFRQRILHEDLRNGTYGQRHLRGKHPEKLLGTQDPASLHGFHQFQLEQTRYEAFHFPRRPPQTLGHLRHAAAAV